MSTVSESPYFTLESIAQQKNELREKLRVQKEIMTDTARELFAPLPPAASKSNAIMRSFNTGMAVFDGIMMGMKLLKRLRKMFASKKK